MNILVQHPWFCGLLLGFWLAIGDSCAIEVRRSSSFVFGLVAWLLLVAVPLGVSFVVSTQVGFIAAVAGIVFSAAVNLPALALLRKQFEQGS